MKVSIKGVAVGSITDIVSTNLAMLPLIIYITFSHAIVGEKPDQVTHMVGEILRDNPLYIFLSLFLGGACSVLGGYVSARLAKHDEILNGACASVLCVTSGVYGMISGVSTTPLWQDIVFLPLGPALAALGGYLRLRQVIGARKAQ